MVGLPLTMEGVSCESFQSRFGIRWRIYSLGILKTWSIRDCLSGAETRAAQAFGARAAAGQCCIPPICRP
jgi:hypothetical protein